jgi:pimeloyl-ACP methyl ester carboxylesterase
VKNVGHFRSDAARTHFLEIYDAGLAELPPRESLDVPTSFGTVRAYRFDGPPGRPVVLLPGRNASTPMWADNLSGLLRHRTVYCLDLLGEPGLSEQTCAITGADDQARWLDEALAGLGQGGVHLLGLSFGGWSAVNHAVRTPGRVTSLTLLDPVLTFAPIPIRTMLAMIPLGLPGAPERLRRRVMSWTAGGAEVDESVPVARLIDAGSTDFALHQPTPARFTDAELTSIDVPVLTLIAGRSVIHDAPRAASHARKTLRHGRVELWPDASHAINGEFPERIAETAGRFWDDVDHATGTVTVSTVVPP